MDFRIISGVNKSKIGTGHHAARAAEPETNGRSRDYAVKCAVRCVLVAASIAGIAGTAIAQTSARRSYLFHHENVLGTTLEFRLQADSDEAAARAEQRALAEIDRLAKIFSTYDASSEFSRWQSTLDREQPVSPELFTVLRDSERWRVATQGAFNPGVELFSRLWRTAGHEGVPPAREALAAAAVRVNRAHWKLDAKAKTAERLSDVPLTLNAIAKGAIIDFVGESVLAEPGVHGFLLMIGGDLAVGGSMPETVDIADPTHPHLSAPPLTTVRLQDRAMATSGNYERGVRVGARWYSHVIDPRNGIPAAEVIGCSVIARRAADADALATAFSVLPVAESLSLANRLSGVECLIITSDGGRHPSAGWEEFETPALALAAADQGDAKSSPPGKPAEKKPAWNGGMELRIDFEINQVNNARYRRPYVAVWVEDKDDFPVRTLVLWVTPNNGLRWLPDLRRWHRSDRFRKLADETDLVKTVSGATRKPGKYSTVWDGADDSGKLVPPGEYTIFIEAAREHGSYQMIRRKVALADKPFSETLDGNLEIKSASLHYGKPGPTPARK